MKEYPSLEHPLFAEDGEKNPKGTELFPKTWFIARYILD